jgi:hypothetical protein
MWHTSWRVPNWSDSNRTSSCILFIWPFIWQKDVLMGIAFQDPDRKNRSYQRPWCLFPSSWLAAFCCGSHVHVHFSQVVDHMHACSRLRAFGSFSLARLVQHVDARLSLSLSDPYLSRIHSFSNRTGPAVGPLKDRTRAYTGPVHLKDRLCNRTAKNRLNRPVFCRTGEPGGSMWTGAVF